MRKLSLPGEESYTEGTFQIPEHSANIQTKKTDFKPWHKIRKQWVRKFQWINEIDTLHQYINFNGERPLKYLSLPGKDMLDVRCVHEWCQANAVKLRYLGYNDPNDPADPNNLEMNFSEAELAQSEFIEKNSTVVPDKLEMIGDRSSIAYTKMIDAGPFDIINLDLCKSAAGYIPLKKQDDIYNAIYEIIAYQKKYSHEPWLFFLTTRANQRSVHPVAGNKFFECIEQNAVTYESFRNSLERSFNIDLQTTKTQFARNITVDGRVYRHLLGLGLGKWLLGLLFTGQPKWKIRMLESAEYRVRGLHRTPDMLSLAFECTRIEQNPVDRVGLARNPSVPPQCTVDEDVLALGLIDSVMNIKDLDSIMQDDDSLRFSLIDEATNLMTAARYDGDIFREWALRN